MKRPNHLPDFTKPPLDEVVLGVQFAPVPTYTSVNSRDVWELFRTEFPDVEEHPLLQQQFETFGGSNLQPVFQFQVGSPVGNRLWFISKQKNHLLQFQSDRFLANWRKSPNPNPYPRFESISEAFERNLNTLVLHFSSTFDHSLEVNQAEISYVNLIPVEDFSSVGEWFTIWTGQISSIEGLNTSFNEVVMDERGKPYARLFHSIQSVYSLDGKRAFNLSLTFRGRPLGHDVGSAMKFFAAGREAIVMKFKQMTTASAHQHWGIQV